MGRGGGGISHFASSNFIHPKHWKNRELSFDRSHFRISTMTQKYTVTIAVACGELVAGGGGGGGCVGGGGL